MAYRKVPNLNIENAQIIFRNFSGNETQFNRLGNRNFCVIIEDSDMAEQLSRDGWNVKVLNSRDEADEPKHFIRVALEYDHFPPDIYLICGRVKTLLTEDTVRRLDSAEISNVDLSIRPYCWEVNGATGIKAYVKEMYVTIEESAFAAKYAEDEYPE